MAKKRKISIRKVCRLLLVLFCIVALVAVGVHSCNGASGEPASSSNPTSAESPASSVVSKVDPMAKYAAYDDTAYAIDVSEYLQYIEPKSDEYLFLVNPEHPLAADDVPSDLVDCIHTRKDGRKTQQLRLYAAKALEAFLAEGQALGKVDNVSVTSAYRSYSYQDYLFNHYCEQHQSKFATREECEKYVLTFSTRPGTSEHQSGLSLDMHNLGSANSAFAKEPEAKWLAENCYRFGFILRYPDGKTDITGIKYEPWHFRYVGRYHATRMQELGLCLDEYIEQYASDSALSSAAH
ncbi:MAG: M15 family metallopeptidase [Clostridia bacterium]|nr:M15 family metallopeptidase [Clostridia bacterium]